MLSDHEPNADQRQDRKCSVTVNPDNRIALGTSSTARADDIQLYFTRIVPDVYTIAKYKIHRYGSPSFLSTGAICILKTLSDPHLQHRNSNSTMTLEPVR